MASAQDDSTYRHVNMTTLFLMMLGVALLLGMLSIAFFSAAPVKAIVGSVLAPGWRRLRAWLARRSVRWRLGVGLLGLAAAAIAGFAKQCLGSDNGKLVLLAPLYVVTHAKPATAPDPRFAGSVFGQCATSEASNKPACDSLKPFRCDAIQPLDYRFGPLLARCISGDPLGYYITDEGGPLTGSRYVNYIVLDGRPRLLDRLSTLHEAIAPITTANQALEDALVSTQYRPYFGNQDGDWMLRLADLVYFKWVLEDTYVTEDGSGFIVHNLLDTPQVFGCGKHESYLVAVRVGRDASVTVLSSESAFRFRDEVCID